MKKNLGIVLSVLVFLAVIAGGYKSYQEKHGNHVSLSGMIGTGSNSGITSPSNPLSNPLSNPFSKASNSTAPLVKIIAGSAKFAFLKDPDLGNILDKQGMRLELIKSGAFEVDKVRAGEIDAAWPASAGAAADWAGNMPGSSSYPVFSTPLALASWRSLMPMFEKNGLAKMSGPTHGDFDLEKALPLMVKGTRWNQLLDNTAFNVNKSFLINTPDLRQGVTGGLYIATLAYILNGHEVPQNAAKAEALAQTLTPLITRQGFQENTLAGPFEDYIGQGIGKAPLVLVYESQFFEAKRDGKIRDTHILLYPQPGLMLKHVLVGKTPAGKKLGELLANDPEIQKIAAKYGFRTNNPALFAAQTKTLGMDAPELINLAETPSPAILDVMTQSIINKIESK